MNRKINITYNPKVGSNTSNTMIDKTGQLLEPVPDHSSNVFQNSVFKASLSEKIYSIKNRPLPPDGQKWKRTPFDALLEKGQLSEIYLVSEYAKIIEHKSDLSSNIRYAVALLVESAVKTMYVKYAKVNSMA